MKKKFFDYKLQLLADDPAPADPAPADPKPADPAPADPKPAAKYTDEDVDKLINKKFAEWSAAKDKELAEAEKRAKMTEQERAEAEKKDLEDQLAGYKARELKNNLTNVARTTLTKAEVPVSDEIVERLIADDEEKTVAAATSFAELFKKEVSKAVAEALKGNPPKAGSAGGSALTKEDIMAIKNPAERQKKIAENIHLFK